MAKPQKLKTNIPLMVASIISKLSSSLKLLFFNSSSMHSVSISVFKLASCKIFVSETLFYEKKQSPLNFSWQRLASQDGCLPSNLCTFVAIVVLLHGMRVTLGCVPFSMHTDLHSRHWPNRTIRSCALHCWTFLSSGPQWNRHRSNLYWWLRDNEPKLKWEKKTIMADSYLHLFDARRNVCNIPL